jgi:phosphoglycolate phosphatase-like HAD superfamily hydrolase
MSSDATFEILRPNLPRGRFRVALFDFDGTLSLLREGWPAIMSELMLGELGRTGQLQGDQLGRVVESIVIGMNGEPTIVQMQALAKEVAQVGRRPKEPEEYARQYQERLLAIIGGRYDAVRSGLAKPADWAVPGTHAFLEELRARGLKLVLASGTEAIHVRREAELLDVGHYFNEAIFAPGPGDKEFTKRAVFERVMSEHGLRGEELIGFGDGVIETQEVRRAGGVAVAVASEEPPRRGVNAWKRERLILAGADVVIADFECREPLLKWLFAEN